MSIYKRGGVYWFRFQFDGKSIRESTSQSNDKIARTMESNRRTELARAKHPLLLARLRLATKVGSCDLRLDDLSDQHAQQFAAQHFKLSPSGINRGLRTLRRALNLAFQWQARQAHQGDFSQRRKTA